MNIIVGLIFWFWALYNVIILKDNSSSVHNGIDFGIFSMIFLIFCGIYGISSVKSSHISIQLKFSFANLIMTPISHILIILNFIGGLILSPTKHYSIFCLIFIIGFIISLIHQYYCSYKWYKSTKFLKDGQNNTDIILLNNKPVIN